MISETCPDCGAERPCYLGGSHFKRCSRHGVVHRMCCDGRSADEAWESHYNRPWPVA